MQSRDLIALGLMTFALFLGAGNVIYPPMVGQHAGYELLAAAGGFLLTAVGLPLLALVSMARVGGPEEMTRVLPRSWCQAFWIVLFLVIGPAFAIPRMSVVAYEMGFDPFLTDPQSWHLAVYSVVFYSVALLLAFHPSLLVSTIGGYITPVLVVLLAVIAWGTLTAPKGEIGAPVEAYIAHPFSEGLLQGYMTMDCIAALGFGAVIGMSVRQLGITHPVIVAKYSAYAGVMAAVGLCLVYLMLMYLGATSHSVAAGATNGAEVLTSYVEALFGFPGKLALAAVITLACLTTAIGVGSACANYFSQTFKTSYPLMLTAVMVISAVVSNAGLTELIAISVPAVVALYPLAVALIVMGLLRYKISNAPVVYRYTFFVVAMFAIFDGLNTASLAPEAIVDVLTQYLPLFKQGLGWILPFIITLTFTWFFTLKRKKNTAIA
ncbi:branched-chain amino acid transport system II carrier protein [Endozoicomonas sp.]|nr:branched-chain amino acid transport system II carrier protein [Endozoicomonas sp.]